MCSDGKVRRRSSSLNIFDHMVSTSPNVRVLVSDRAHVYSRPCFSPGGDRILYMRAPSTDNPKAAENADTSPWTLWTVPLQGGESTPFFADPSLSVTRPDWCMTTGRVVFTGIRDGRAELWVVEEDGSRTTRVTVGAPALTRLFYPTWYPGSRRVAVTDYEARRVLEVDLRRQSFRVLTDATRLWAGMSSVCLRGEGRVWLAFAGQAPSTRHDLGRNGIWIQSPETPPWRLGSAPGRMPAWSPDGTRLAYVSTGGALRRHLTRQRGQVLVQGIGDSPGEVEAACPVTPWHRAAAYPKWSPDGRLITCMLEDRRRGAQAIAVIDLLPGITASRVVSIRCRDSAPAPREVDST
jgi:Tol biopolymer transport system component